MTTSSFQTIFMAHRPRLMNMALILTSDRDKAMNLLRETAANAAKSRSVTDVDEFDSWMNGIMRSTYFAHYQNNHTVDTACNHERMDVESGNSTFDSATGVLTADDVDDAIAGLDEIYAKPYKMHIAGYDCIEIAHELGITTATARFRVQYACRAIR